MKTFRSITVIIYLSAFLLVSAGTQVIAQDAYRFNLSVNAGPATALGQLSSQHYKSGGYALSGFSSSVEGTWFFRPALGVGFAVSDTKFPFADGAFAHDKVNSDPELESLFLKSGPYQVRTYTGGIYFRRHISGKFSASAKLTGGLLWAKTPDQLFSASFFGVPNIGYKITPSRTLKAAIQPGLAVRYKLFEHVDLSLNADYTFCNTAFQFHTATDSYMKKITFSYLNTMIGINFQF